MTTQEIINSDKFQDILEELLCDFGATKALWLKEVKGCKSPIAKFIPTTIKKELASKTTDEITLEVAEYFYYNS